MLIKRPKTMVIDRPFTELQKMAIQFLPAEQIKKFADFQHLIETELLNEAREPEIENTLKDLFDALHERNTPKLLKTLQGDKRKMFYAFRKQLEMRSTLTKKQAKMLKLISTREVSLLTISLIRD